MKQLEQRIASHDFTEEAPEVGVESLRAVIQFIQDTLDDHNPNTLKELPGQDFLNTLLTSKQQRELYEKERGLDEEIRALNEADTFSTDDISIIWEHRIMDEQEEAETQKDYVRGREAYEAILALDVDELDVEEVAGLVLDIRYGRFAWEKLIKLNRKLVAEFAHRYSSSGLVPYEDLVSAGTLGLMRALETFDPEKGRLSTYSGHWIRRYVQVEFTTMRRTARVPHYLYNEYVQIEREMKEAERQNINPYQYAAEQLETTVDRVRKVLRLNRMAVELDAPVNTGRDSHRTLGDIVPDDAGSPTNTVEYRIQQEDIVQYFKVLTPKEKEVLILYFGLFGNKEHTYREIGERFNLTRQRILQIRMEAEKKLRRKLRWHKEEILG